MLLHTCTGLFAGHCLWIVQRSALDVCAGVQVNKAASKGSSVADKAGSAAKDIKGKNPFGEWGLAVLGK